MAVMSKDRYSAIAVSLHWAIAALILYNLVTGTFMENLEGEAKHIVVSLHNSSGLTVLLLSLVRLAVRLAYRPPAFNDALSSAERMAATTVHALFYVLMIGMPLVGWAITSVGRKSTSMLYLLTPLPRIAFLVNLPTPVKSGLHGTFVTTHTAGACILFALLIAHVGGALKHQFMDRQPQLARMWF